MIREGSWTDPARLLGNAGAHRILDLPFLAHGHPRQQLVSFHMEQEHSNGTSLKPEKIWPIELPIPTPRSENDTSIQNGHGRKSPRDPPRDLNAHLKTRGTSETPGGLSKMPVPRPGPRMQGHTRGMGPRPLHLEQALLGILGHSHGWGARPTLSFYK